MFILQAYFLAKGISVVGDYVCYHHRRRSGNAASTPWEPAFYYKYVRANLDVIERNTTPGPFRDRLLRRVASTEMLSRLAGRKFVAATPERRAALLAEIRSILEDYVPPDFDLQLIPPLRAVAGLARADRLDLLRRARQGGGAGDPDGGRLERRVGRGTRAAARRRRGAPIGRQGDRHRAVRAGRMATAGSRRGRRGHAVRAPRHADADPQRGRADGGRPGRRRHVARDPGRVRPGGGTGRIGVRATARRSRPAVCRGGRVAPRVVAAAPVPPAAARDAEPPAGAGHRRGRAPDAGVRLSPGAVPRARRPTSSGWRPRGGVAASSWCRSARQTGRIGCGARCRRRGATSDGA